MIKLEFPLGRGVNFQIQVENLSPIISSLESSHVNLFTKVQDNWYDVGERTLRQRELLVQDPDGYLLRLIQHLGEDNNPNNSFTS